MCKSLMLAAVLALPGPQRHAAPLLGIMWFEVSKGGLPVCGVPGPRLSGNAIECNSMLIVRQCTIACAALLAHSRAIDRFNCLRCEP